MQIDNTATSICLSEWNLEIHSACNINGAQQHISFFFYFFILIKSVLNLLNQLPCKEGDVVQ